MKELTELELADLWKEVKEDFWGDISLQTQKMVKKLMETTSDCVKRGETWRETRFNPS